MERMMILSESLPNDLVIEILKRMPVRSLLRFKSVSKSWYSQISDPQFTKSHFDLAAATTHRILYHYHNSEFKAVDTEASLHHDSAVVLSAPSRSYISKFGYDLKIKGSCRGFILFKNPLQYTSCFDVWNPSTGLHKQILLKRTMREEKKICTHLFGIGYDSSTDDYLIVAVALMLSRSQISTRLFKLQVQFFSFRTNSWSCTESIVQYDFSSDDGGLFFNGALHWLVEIYSNSQGVFSMIITFDLQIRRLSEILLPPDVPIDREQKFFGLTIVRDCLCVFSRRSMVVESWIMKEYKVESSWTKFFNLSSNYFDFSYYFFAVCFTKNDEILGSDHKALVRINKKGKLIEHRSAGRMITLCPASWYRENLLSLLGRMITLCPASCYKESLLSLPGRMITLCPASCYRESLLSLPEVEDAQQ